MKKILAVMLSIMILVSTITLVTEASEVLIPVAMYAGARTVTIEYDRETLSSENIGEISLKTFDGTPVDFTTKINGKILSIIADEEFIRDTQSYFIEIGGLKKLFTIKTLFKPNFVADVANKKVSGLSFGRGNGVVVDVVDENTVVLGVNEGGFVIDYDDIKNYENASIVADVYYTGDSTARANSAFAYNLSSKTPTYAFTYNGAVSVHRAFWLLNEQSSKFYNRRVAITDGTALKEFVGYSTNELPVNTTLTDNDMKISISSNNYGSTFVSSASTVGTTTLPENFEANAYKYHYVIDKMGTVGTLLMNDTFIDVMDSKEYFDAYNTSNSASLSAPATGYFAISPVTSNFRIIVSNVALITSTMRELASGTVSVESVSTSGTEVTIKFKSEGSDFNLAEVDNLTDYIILSEGEYEILSASGDTAVLKVKNISYENATVTVKQGLGYDELRVESDIIENYIFVAREGELAVESFTGGDSEITINFNLEITDVKVNAVKDKIKLSLNGEQVNYTPIIKDNSITLDLDESLKRDVVYDLHIDAGFGYEKVLTKNALDKYFVMETVVNETFDEGMASDYVSVSRNGECTTAESIPNLTVRNGKLYIEETDWLTVYFNKFGLEKHRDYIMKFNMEHYKAAANDNFLFNVPKEASGIAHYGANLKGAGWRIKSGEWVELMQWGPARTGQKGLYAEQTNPGGAIPGHIAENVVIAGENGEVTVPVATPVSTTYTVEKYGSKAKLYVNGSLVDSIDMVEMFSAWNSKYPENQITDAVPEKGLFVYSAARSTGSNGPVASAVAFDSMEVSVFKEYTDGKVVVVDETKTITGTSANGNVKIRNFANEPKKVVAIVSAYGENKKFLGAQKVADKVLNPGEFEDATFSFSGSQNIEEITTDVICDNLSKTDIKVTSMLQTDFDNNIIKVNGTVEKDTTDRDVYLMFVKDDIFSKDWTNLSETDGNFEKISVKANTNDFEYSFKFKDDSTDYAKMSLYKLTWTESGLEYENIATYHYAKNDAVNTFVETTKTTKVSPSEVEKYTQSLGIDFKFADNDNKKNVVAETIYDERAKITDRSSLTSIIETARARILLLSDIKNKTSNAANVNSIIKKYEADAVLDTTAYNSLTEAQKIIVCNKFINADYEETGFSSFKKAFNNAVTEAKKPAPPSGGGGGGGGSIGAGATGGLPMNVTDTPAKDAVEIIGTKQGFVDMSEYAWAEKAVNALADRGVITGVGDKKFNPDGTVTREQIAKMIVSALNELDNEATVEYKDVDTSGWAYKFIASAKKSGLMKGFSETEFAPLSAVTREDLCVILYRATLKKNKQYKIRKTDFTDKTEIADYAKDAVEFMSGAGIINGFEDGSFNPKAPATRAQAAVLIYNALIGGNKQ